MLTSEHAIVEYRRGRAIPDRLTRPAHAHYVDYARRALGVYRAGVGRQRRHLHRSVEKILFDEPDCPVRRIRAICKLLDDRSTYQSDPAGDAGRLRLRVFQAAAEYHPLVREPDRLFERAEAETKRAIAARLGTSWDEIDRRLYADVMSFQRLEAFEGYAGPEALLSRYNVAQIQACLYRAERITVTATGDFKTILRYAKLARLLHQIERTGPSRYRIELTGPASALRRTRRYGVSFARFAAALLACRGWSMTAAIATPWQTKAQLRLSDRDGYRSHLPPPKEFDSSVEESFAGKFGRKREGWRMEREGRIVCERQTAFVPDFVFRHDDGTEVLMEIVGFWTPQYLAEKRRTLRRFRRHRILLAVAARNVREDATIGDRVVVYKTKLLLKPVMDALERTRNARQPEATSAETGQEEAKGRRTEEEAGNGRPLSPAERQTEGPPGRGTARP